MRLVQHVHFTDARNALRRHLDGPDVRATSLHLHLHVRLNHLRDRTAQSTGEEYVPPENGELNWNKT